MPIVAAFSKAVGAKDLLATPPVVISKFAEIFRMPEEESGVSVPEGSSEEQAVNSRAERTAAERSTCFIFVGF